jgi:8-amino-7-oxononanoate synthase
MVELDGHRLLNFSANDYLGLAGHPSLIHAAHSALDSAGFGAGASRLVVGNHREHDALEDALRRFHEADAVLCFNSGYHANIGVLPALASRGAHVFSDALNHASVIDGCRLSRARVTIYPHCGLAELAAELAASGSPRKLIVTDAVFSMDGDIAPLAALRQLADDHNAMLVVDEAHAVGALGPGGRGMCAAAAVVPDLLVGTLGKAFGSFGAYVCASEPVVELLRNSARSFVYTTGLPPAVAAASRAAVELLAGPVGRDARRRLMARIAELAEALGRVGARSPIFPVIVGDDRAAVRLTERLMTSGLYVQAIRPPTVPEGTARLRIAVSAAHSANDIQRLSDALRDHNELA